MNETLKSIKERRSVRGYNDTMPSKEQLDAIIESALFAPSAMNCQPCHFTVVTNPEIIDFLNESTKKYIGEDSKKRLIERTGSENFSVFYDAPCVIVLSLDGSLPSYNDIDAGIAVQNICLAAHSLGLSSCIIGMTGMMFDKPECDELAQRINLPSVYRPRISIAIGYGIDGTSTMHPRKEGRISYSE